MQCPLSIRLPFKPHIIHPLKSSLLLFSRSGAASTTGRLPRRRVKLKAHAFDDADYVAAGELAISGDEISLSGDLAPTTARERFFTGWDMANLWVGLVVGVPAYYLAGSLVDLGMAWWQGIATVFLANLILLVPLVLTGVPGAKYGIPFPVLARSAFGVNGAHLPTLLRALVGCGWYGIESWIGGEAVFLLLPETVKSSALAWTELSWLGTSPLKFLCFMCFWSVQLALVFNGMDGIRKLEKYSAPVLIILTIALLGWAYSSAGGFGNMLKMTSRLSPSQFLAVFFPSLTANISFWATLALNIPDFTRYAKTQKDQILGHVGLPIFMGIFTLVGLAVTSSTGTIFGEIISDPIQLLGRVGGFETRLLAILGISLATITTNIAANVVAPANALVNLCPSLFTFGRGALLTAVLGVFFQPWRLLQTSESFVYTWLVGYSALLGPIGGVILTDYYLIRKGELDLGGLYSSSPQGPYYYRGGWNVAAVAALAAGILIVVPGFLSNVGLTASAAKFFLVVYDNAWFVSTFVSGLLYWLLSRATRRD